MKSTFKTIALAGILAGTLDACTAMVNFYLATGKNPIVVWQYVASGLLGSDAFSSTYMAVLGLLLHFIIATGWSAFYYIIYPRIGPLSRNVFVAAIVYGIFVWIVMNLVVLPLSRVRPLVHSFDKVSVGMLILILCIGLPIVWLVSRHYKDN